MDGAKISKAHWGFPFGRTFNMHFHIKRVVIMNAEMRFVNLSVLFLSKDHGKVWISSHLKCRFHQKKRAQSIVLNIWTIFHQIQTMRRKDLIFSKKINKLSLPRITVNNNGMILFGGGKRGKMSEEGSYMGCLDLTFRWVCFPEESPLWYMHSKSVKIFSLLLMSEMNIWMKQINSETNISSWQQDALSNRIK